MILPRELEEQNHSKFSLNDIESFTAFATVIRNYTLQLKWKVTACDEDGW